MRLLNETWDMAGLAACLWGFHRARGHGVEARKA
jgi:hypothetical protein